MIGFEYGNTRLRARRTGLLSAADYDRLITTATIDQLLGSLADTPYADDVENAVARYRGARRVDEALRSNLATTLGEMRSFYQGRPGELVQLLLDRWDLENTRALLRLPALPEASEDVASLTVPAGRLDDAAIRELAAVSDPAGRVDLIVAWGIPSRDLARGLLRVRPDYLAEGDVAVLELALDRAFAAHLDEVLDDESGDAAAVLRSRIDATNLLTALRVREARLGGEPVPADLASLFLPAGIVSTDLWEAAAHTDDAEAAAAAVTARRVLPGWARAVERWLEREDLPTLAADLGAATSRAAQSLFVTGDPLGFDVPVAYTAAKEAEVRNIRLVARGIVHGLAAPVIADLLEVA